MKKGYMLTECFIAMAIILIMTMSFVSLSLYINSVYKKSVIINLGIQQIRNIETIFLVSDFENNSEINFEDFEQNLTFAYSNFTKNNTTYKITFTEDLIQKTNGKIIIESILSTKTNKVSIVSKIYNTEKEYYSTPFALEKVVL